MPGSVILTPSVEVGHLATITIYSGTEDTSYPRTLLCDFSNGDVEAKPAMMTSFAGQWLLNFGSVTRIDYVVLWHAFPVGLNVRFLVGTAIPADLDAGFTIPAKRANGHSVQVFKDLRGVTGYTAAGKQYAMLSVPTSAVAPATKMLCYSTGATFTHDIFMGPPYNRRQQVSVQRTDFGHRWPLDLHGYTRTVECRMFVNDAELASLDAWFESSAGSVKLSTLILDKDVNEAIIGFIPPASFGGPSTSGLDVKYHSANRLISEVKFPFEMVTSGLPEWT